MSTRMEYGGTRAVLYWKNSEEETWGLILCKFGVQSMVDGKEIYISLTISSPLALRFPSSSPLSWFFFLERNQSSYAWSCTRLHTIDCLAVR